MWQQNVCIVCLVLWSAAGRSFSHFEWLSPKMLLQYGTIQTDRTADLKVHRPELATSNVYAWTYTEMFD